MELLHTLTDYFFFGWGKKEIDLLGWVVMLLSIPIAAVIWPFRYENQHITRDTNLHYRRFLITVLMAVPPVIYTHNLAYIALVPFMYYTIPSGWLFRHEDLGRNDRNTQSDVTGLVLSGLLLGIKLGIITFILGGGPLIDTLVAIVFLSAAVPTAYFVGWYLYDHSGYLQRNTYDGRTCSRVLIGIAVAITLIGLIQYD